jgi:AcrR family transcriptional regulator
MARGRPPAHTREQVLAAAIRVADTEGLAAVSMRRVATEIGAGAMSLYTYVPDKERLIDLMVDAVGGEASPVAATGDWRADLLAVAGQQRALMLAHRWLPEALPNRRMTGPHVLAYLEQGLAALAPTGLDGPTRLEVMALVTGFVASFVTGELADPVPPAEQATMIREAIATGGYPHLAAALAQSAGPRRETSFERLATWMITGLVEQAQR